MYLARPTLELLETLDAHPTLPVGLVEDKQLEDNVSELEWFDYTGQTTDELIALEGEFRTDSLVLAFEHALNQKAERFGEGILADEERVILVIEAVEREVNNGGYDQLFTNEARYSPLYVAALHRIGCIDVARLTQQAIDTLGIDGPVTAEAIEEVIYDDDEARTERLDELDRQYYDVAGDLSGPLLEFIKCNRDKITLQA